MRITFPILLACSWLFATNIGTALEFQSDGTIVAGDFRLILKPDAVISLTDPDGLLYDLFFPLSYPAGTSPETQRVKLEDPKIAVDGSTEQVTLTARVEPPNGKPFQLLYSMAATPAGRVRVTLKADLTEPVAKFLNMRGDLHVSREAVVNGVIEIGGEKILVPKEPPGKNTRFRQGPAQAVVLNAGNPEKQLSFFPIQQSDFSVSDQNTVSYRPPFLAMTFGPKHNELVYEIEFPSASGAPKSEDTYAGIDFWKSGQLHMPQYDQNRNLVQNPGFEAGFAYWHWASLGRFPVDPKYDEFSEISSVNPHHGQRVLALRGQTGATPAEVATFAIPVEKGQDYTFSFYARGDNPKQRVNLNAQGFFTPPFMLWKTIDVTGPEWKRYTFTFTTTHSVLNVSFANAGTDQDDWVFVDSVQVEKGSEATEFTTKPVMAWVTGGTRGNLWEPGTEPNALLHLSGMPNSSGKVSVSETDFFGKMSERGVLEYQLDSNGETSIPLPWAAELLPGIHVITMKTTTPGGFVGTDTGRLTVMSYLANQHLHKNLFSAQLGDVTGSWKRQAEFFKRVGLGSAILFDPRSHLFHQALDDNGILHFSSIFDGGQGFKKQMGWEQHEHGFELTTEQLKQIEEFAYQKAKAYPEVKYWKLNNEPDLGPFIDNIPKMNKMVDALIAARKGTLRANPEAVLVGSDPANMYASSGIAFVNTQLDAIGDRKVYDIPAIHPYRERPEAPDRDAETKLYLDVLDRHGYHGDTWFTEGIYHQNWIVPEWSLNTHKGCSTDHFRAGALSYDLGWGEKMNAAYAARSWLVSLKYGDRVKLDVDWGFYTNSSSDVDLTPGAIAFATNTLGHILGNATFKADLSLGYEVRGYVFQDENNVPIAVIWFHNIECDKGKTAGPALDVSELAKAYPQLTYRDFMGNPHPLPKSLAIGPFPVFIQGEKGTLDSFLMNLGQASLVDDKGALFVSLSTESATQAIVRVENSINKSFKGSYRLLKGTELLAKDQLTIEPKKSWTHLVEQPLKPDAVDSTILSIELTPEGKTEAAVFKLEQRAMAWPKRKQAITFTGNLKDWESAFHIPITNTIEFPPHGDNARKYRDNPMPWKGVEDLDATLYATWDDANLYLAFSVKDDVLHPNARPDLAWNGDSVQLYFDGWADGRTRRERGYGPDDQTFGIWPNPAGSILRRDVTPERQLAFLDAGPVKEARLVVTRKENVTFYELALPLKDLYPLELKAGAKFGFAPLINDDDGDYRKRALTLTPGGTEPFNHPELFPSVVLMP